MGQIFDAKLFNPEVFGQYVNRIANPKRTQLARSQAIGTNAQASSALSSQTGSFYAKVPYFGRISGSTSQNNDGVSNITKSSTDTFSQGFVVASRMDGWGEKSFSTNITAGVDFMDNIAGQIAEYKYEVMQGLILSMLKGAFAMDTTGNGKNKKAQKAFVDGHTFTITTNMEAGTLNKAIAKACGDNKGIFSLVFMHSVVATNLENLRLLEYLKYTDADGIQRELSLATWNGRLVLIDDEMPVGDVYELTTDTAIDATKTYYTYSSGTYTAVSSPDVSNIGTYYEKFDEYTTYVLGQGAVILDNVGDAVPYEMDRNPAVNGGETYLYVRDRYICGLAGLDFVPTSGAVSVDNSTLESGDSWTIVNNGQSGNNYVAIEDKLIPIARIKSRG